MPMLTTYPKTLLISALFSAPLMAQAQVIELSLDEWHASLQSDTNPQQLLLERIQGYLDEADLSFESGNLIYRESQRDVPLREGCASSKLNTLESSLTVQSPSAIRLQLDTLQDPISAGLSVQLQYQANGSATQRLGIGGGSACVSLGRDTFDVSAEGQVTLNLSLTLSMNPAPSSDQRYVEFSPTLALSGSSQASRPIVDVDNSALSGPLQTYIQREFEDALSESRFQTLLRELESDLQSELADSFGNEPLRLALPDLQSPRASGLRALLLGEQGFPVSPGFLADNRYALISAALLDQQETLEGLLEGSAVCAASETLMAEMQRPSFYQLDALGQCQQAPSVAQSGLYYSDASCQAPFNYQASSLADYCEYALSGPVGTPSANDSWTYSSGTQLDLSVESLAGKVQPLTQSRAYKVIDTDKGQCDLEMRIYTDDPNGQERPALVAYHGGSWKYRRFGALGLASSAAHFVEQGFVVFVPFYRLTADGEAPEACTGVVMEDILADARDALDWVDTHRGEYGIAAGELATFGQSAGGFISAYLGHTLPERISKSMVMYAPLDFRQYLAQLTEGTLGKQPAENIITGILGRPLAGLSLDDADVLRYSLPSRMDEINPQAVHTHLYLGHQDELLPNNQASRYCAALHGNTDQQLSADQALTQNAVMNTWRCGEHSRYVELFEAEHAMEFCVPGVICKSGQSLAAIDALATQLAQSRAWLAQPISTPPLNDAPLSNNTSSSSSPVLTPAQTTNGADAETDGADTGALALAAELTANDNALANDDIIISNNQNGAGGSLYAGLLLLLLSALSRLAPRSQGDHTLLKTANNRV